MPIENLLRFMDMVMSIIASKIILSIQYSKTATIDTNTNDLSMHLGIFYAFDNDGKKPNYYFNRLNLCHILS